ncbi:MAG TPA: hypothetical protein VFV19_08085 [Candidatus Polarisedimenticolaceae bacterium]|nr:hypothetical protein [Candidatus Polarisedimenticolaceae bacterium]
MRHTGSLILAALLALPAAATEQEHISKTFDLADGGTVDVSRIAGPVEIAIGGDGKVDVDIVRSAPTKEDLACGAVVIEPSPTKVEIRTESKCDNVRGSQQVKLTVPRSADLSLRTIAGSLRVGATDGMLKLESIAGRVELAGVREARMSSIAGGLELSVAGIGDRGIRVSSVTGGIDLEVTPSTDAQLEAHSVAGHVESDVPGLRLVEAGEADYRAILGSGGPAIVLQSVVGKVKIHG